MEIIELKKLSQHQAGMTSAYRRSLFLMDAGWMRFPAASWDKPAIIALADGDCIAGINWSEDDVIMRLTIDFAWCEPGHPKALALVLLRFRAKFKGSDFQEVGFTCHDGNEPMAKAVRVLGLSPVSRNYRMTLTA